MNITNGSEFSNRLRQEFCLESDRGFAILSVCLLEEALANVFAKVLPEGKNTSRQFMPRGRLAQGVTNAAALGLITEPLIINLQLILKVRNTFAHKLLEGLTFESPEIRTHVMKLTLPNLDGVSDASRTRIEQVSRERYMVVFDAAISALERVRQIAATYPVYKALPAVIIEL
jgi:hypothetical protein